jgi:hypothetical protein
MEMNDVEILYESLIAEIFRETSSLKLLTEKAYYVETGWEQVQYMYFEHIATMRLVTAYTP